MSSSVIMRISGNWLVLYNAEKYFPQLCGICSFIYKHHNLGGHIRFSTQKCYLIEKDRKTNSRVFICRTGLRKAITDFFFENKIPFTIKDDYDPNLPCYQPDLSVLETVSLRPFQRDCIEAIIKNRQGLINTATGFGKTFILSLLTKIYPNAKFVIICRSREVVNEVLNRCYQLGIQDVAKVDGNVRDAPNKRVLIFTAASLHKCPYDHPDFILADECHELVTPKTVHHLYRFNKGRMYGFSATINTRADGAQFHLKSIFGEEIFKLDFKSAQGASMIVPIVVRWFPVTSGRQVTGISSIPIRKRVGIWTNIYRNKVIAYAARQHYKHNQQVLVLVETVEHACHLKRFLPEFVVCAANIDPSKLERYRKIFPFIDEVIDTIKRRDEIREQFHQRKIMGVIATNIWSAGVSFDDLEVLVRADGRVSKTVNIQAPGRVCRIPQKLTAKKCGIVIDFIDHFDETLYRQSKKRFRIYREMGWIQCDSAWNRLTRI